MATYDRIPREFPQNNTPEDAEMREMHEIGHTTGMPRYPENFRPSIADRVVFNRVRRIVSQNRRRLKHEGLDLDFAYITDRIIAMGYPSVSWESAIRNPMTQTINLLNRRHGEGKVKVFNLRGGFFYDPKKFHNNVITFDMTDHHPPKLELMAPFCREAKEWLDLDSSNVIAVHCKAGKGRTGVMICALLIYMKFYESPRQVLDYYSIVRTKNNKGVTIPSQRRYIYYYAKLRELSLNYFPIRMQFLGVYLECPPNTNKNGIGGGACRIKIKASNYDNLVLNSDVLDVSGAAWRDEQHAWRTRKADGNENQYNPSIETNSKADFVCRRGYCFMVDQPKFVEGDVRVDLLAQKGFSMCGPAFQKLEKIGHVWFNTMFACRGALTRAVKEQEKEGLSKEEVGKMEDDLIAKAFFEYGDRKEPYPEGETSIAKKELPEKDVFEYPASAGAQPDIGNLKILKPSGMENHTTSETIRNVYHHYGELKPRDGIATHLYEAHAKGIVNDDYNKRHQNAKKGDPVDLGHDLPVDGVNGPMRIRYEDGQHILTFPVYEMDRALKDNDLDDRMRIHVVLKCIDNNDTELRNASEVYCNTHSANVAVESSASSASERSFPISRAPTVIRGAEKHFPPDVRYADVTGTYNGKPSENLIENNWDWRSEHQFWSRFFYKQRRDSISEYKPNSHICPLTHKIFSLYEPGNQNDDDNNDPNKPSTSGKSSKKTWSFKDVPQSSNASSADQPGPAPPPNPESSVPDNSRPFKCNLAEPEQYSDDCRDQMEALKAAIAALEDAQSKHAAEFGHYLEQDLEIELQSLLDTDEDAVYRESAELRRFNVPDGFSSVNRSSQCREDTTIDHYRALLRALQGMKIQEQEETKLKFAHQQQMARDDRELDRKEVIEKAEVKASTLTRHVKECIENSYIKKIEEEKEEELDRLRTLHTKPGSIRILEGMRNNPGNYTKEERESGLDANDPNLTGKMAVVKPPRIIVTDVSNDFNMIVKKRRRSF